MMSWSLKKQIVGSRDRYWFVHSGTIHANSNLQLIFVCIQSRQAISEWVDAAEADFDSMFQVMFDVLGITEAIHKDAEALSDSDSDTLTPLNDVTLDDLLLDDLDGSDTDTGDPLWWEWVSNQSIDAL